MKKDCSPATYPVGYWETPHGCGQVIDYDQKTITIRLYGRIYICDRAECNPLANKGYERPIGGFND